MPGGSKKRLLINAGTHATTTTTTMGTTPTDPHSGGIKVVSALVSVFDPALVYEDEGISGNSLKGQKNEEEDRGGLPCEVPSFLAAF